MEIKINKKVRSYTESIFFGLSPRQSIRWEWKQQAGSVYSALHPLLQSDLLLINL